MCFKMKYSEANGGGPSESNNKIEIGDIVSVLGRPMVEYMVMKLGNKTVHLSIMAYGKVGRIETEKRPGELIFLRRGNIEQRPKEPERDETHVEHHGTPSGRIKKKRKGTGIKF